MSRRDVSTLTDQPDLYYCGIDWHKRTACLHIINSRGERVWVVTVPADAGAVFAQLEPYMPNMVAGVEANTGADDLADELTKVGVTCLVGHPAHLGRGMGGRGKSDRRDAEKIARLLALGEFPHTNRVRKAVRELRTLLRQRASLVAARQGVRARAELRRPCKHGSSADGAGRGDFGNESHFCPDCEAAACDAAADADLTAPIDRLERTAVRLAGQVFADVFPRAVAIHGVGALTAATILAEIGDIGHFRHAENLLSYAGLVPRRRQSGGKVVAVENPRACNRHLKQAFYNAAHSVLVHCPAARTWRGGEDPKDPPKGGERAVSRRLATAIFHVWRDRTPYDPTRAFPDVREERTM